MRYVCVVRGKEIAKGKFKRRKKRKKKRKRRGKGKHKLYAPSISNKRGVKK